LLPPTSNNKNKNKSSAGAENKIKNTAVAAGKDKSMGVDKKKNVASDNTSKMETKDVDAVKNVVQMIKIEVSEGGKELLKEESNKSNESVSEIPTPELHMLSIPLPPKGGIHASKGAKSGEFIGPTLPSNHVLAHMQDIPLPRRNLSVKEKFQRIGPNDPLVFKTLVPPPIPPTSLTCTGGGRQSDPPLPPRPPPLPREDLEDIAGDEEPIPQMLDAGITRPMMIIPPEQADMYAALQVRDHLVEL